MCEFFFFRGVGAGLGWVCFSLVSRDLFIYFTGGRGGTGGGGRFSVRLFACALGIESVRGGLHKRQKQPPASLLTIHICS